MVLKGTQKGFLWIAIILGILFFILWKFYIQPKGLRSDFASGNGRIEAVEIDIYILPFFKQVKGELNLFLAARTAYRHSPIFTHLMTCRFIALSYSTMTRTTSFSTDGSTCRTGFSRFSR